MVDWADLDGWKTDFSMFGWKDLEDGILSAKFQWMDSSLSARFWADSESVDLDEKLVSTDSSLGWIPPNQTRLVGAFRPEIHPPISFPFGF